MNFIFAQIFFYFDEFEGADFKFYNSFSKLQPKNTKIRHFFGTELEVFL